MTVTDLLAVLSVYICVDGFRGCFRSQVVFGSFQEEKKERILMLKTRRDYRRHIEGYMYQIW